VLASGSGSNLQALIDSVEIKPRIACVVSDNPGARALARAQSVGIATEVVEWQHHTDRDSFSAAVGDVVEAHGAKGVVLAGFMRVLSKGFIDRFPNRVLNVHPSLLPAFPGARAVELALRHGVTVTGVTVHIVDEKVDHGPIVVQRPVTVEADDTVEILHARIQVEEHALYPEVVRALVKGEMTVEGRTVVWQ